MAFNFGAQEEEGPEVDIRPLEGRVSIVTGGSGGIGSSICKHLADAGATVIATYKSDENRAHDIVAGLPGEGHRAIQAVTDDDASLGLLAESMRREFGSLDILVNTVGVTRYVPSKDLDALDNATIDELFRVNWRGTFATIRSLRPLLEDGQDPVIVNLSSIAAVTGDGSNVAYCASKAALDSMTRSLARALAPRLRVLSIAPGLVRGRYAKTLDPSWSQRQVDATPLGRIASADDVARAVLAAVAMLTFSTGCVITVDGGRTLGT